MDSPRKPTLPALILASAVILSACVRPATVEGEPWLFPAPPGATQAADKTLTQTPFMPGARDTEQVYDTPTPNPPSTLPPLRSESEIYIVQPGDSLMRIAQAYGVTVPQIIEANALENPDLLEVGQVLEIPAPAPLGTGPDFKIIPDSELVFGPSAIGFDTAAYVAAAGGYLAQYEEEAVEGKTRGGSEILTMVSRDFSIHPRLLLTILEHQSGWLTNPNPAERDYPLGRIDPLRKGLYRQLFWAADNLNRGYYLWRAGGLSAYALPDGALVVADPTINAGTAGVQYFFAQLYGYDTWTVLLSEGGLMATYRKLFGYPFQYTYEPILPSDLVQPPMQLPFQRGAVWNFTGGPHGGWGDGSAWAALDFAPPGDALGCVQSDAWVAAVADGLIVRSESGRVLQDLDGDGNEQTGWVVLYMHIESRDRVQAGEMLEAGDRIGHPSCEGGFSTGTHLHIARKYNGEWIPADRPALPFVLDGWTSFGEGFLYDGWLTKGSLSVIADDRRTDENEISR